VQERLARMVALNREAGVLVDSNLETANERILAGALRVSPKVRPGLIHGDLYPPNTLIYEARFTAMLDFEHAKMWDPIQDFVKLRMWTFEKYDQSETPFLEGYRSVAPATEYFDERFAVCIGLELLAGFPHWKKRTEDAMLHDYLNRFERWIGTSAS
jgi:aminoglycoside phosphotransferase (APT) family kinase protein